MKKSNVTRLKNILVFFDLLSEIQEKDINYFQKRYMQNAENFEDCLELFLSLNLIVISSNKIVSSEQLKQFTRYKQSEDNIKEFFVTKFLLKSNSLIWDYLSKFVYIENKFILEPRESENLFFSNIRNLLIELGFILYRSNKYYEIAEKYIPMFINLLEKRPMSLEKFQKVLKKKDEIGNAAELEVIKYEKHRLSKYKDLVNKIEYMSIINVSAGYDIKSFSLKAGADAITRYIEVKAISNFDSRFYLSHNEFIISQQLGKEYFLYLVPVIGDKEFDIDNIEIIQNPSVNVFNNPKWNVSCEKYVIEKV